MSPQPGQHGESASGGSELCDRDRGAESDLLWHGRWQAGGLEGHGSGQEGGEVAEAVLKGVKVELTKRPNDE